MFKRILCPVDLSTTSVHALDQAIAIARWYKTSVTVLHAYESIFMPVPGLPVPNDRVPEAEMARVRGEVMTLCRPAADAGVPVEVIIDAGHPAVCILDFAAALPADLIVMGTHGAGGFERLVLGSVAEKVLRKANCAVLTVPPHAIRTSALPFKRVLCAVDFSPCSLRALALARSLAFESGAALTAVSVIEWPWDEPPPPVFTELPAAQASALADYHRYVETSAMQRLAALGGEPTNAGVPFDPRISHGKSHVEILRTATDVGADLIVIGVHGRNALDLGVFGSTANQVVRQATCPVLTLRSAN